MPRKKKLSPAEKRAAREKKLAATVIEVARATNDGRTVKQQDIIRAIKERWKERVPGSTLSGYVDRLSGNSLGRAWLQQDGQRVLLSSEDTLLTDSVSIRALLLARRLADADDRVNFSRWAEQCKTKYGHSEDICRRFIRDYIRCGYAVGEGTSANQLQLDLRRLNEDMFYLRHASTAKLKSRPRRTLPAGRQ